MRRVYIVRAQGVSAALPDLPAALFWLMKVAPFGGGNLVSRVQFRTMNPETGALEWSF